MCGLLARRLVGLLALVYLASAEERGAEGMGAKERVLSRQKRVVHGQPVEEGQ